MSPLSVFDAIRRWAIKMWRRRRRCSSDFEPSFIRRTFLRSWFKKLLRCCFICLLF